jgi:hypothetical protein
MKQVFVLILFLGILFFSTTCSRKSTASVINKKDSTSYDVYKIDSIHTYYLIYARQMENNYKILSPKEKSDNCNEIKVNNRYRFKIHSIFIVNGQPTIPASGINELSGWKFDDSTTINFEKGTVWGLFLADNIKGLCFNK